MCSTIWIRWVSLGGCLPMNGSPILCGVLARAAVLDRSVCNGPARSLHVQWTGSLAPGEVVTAGSSSGITAVVATFFFDTASFLLASFRRLVFWWRVCLSKHPGQSASKRRRRHCLRCIHRLPVCIHQHEACCCQTKESPVRAPSYPFVGLCR